MADNFSNYSSSGNKKSGGCLRFLLYFILICIIIGIAVSIFNQDKSDSSSSGQYGYEDKENDDDKGKNKGSSKKGENKLSIPDDIYVPGCSDYYYRQLNKPEKALYVAYIREALKGNIICTLDSVNPSDYDDKNFKRVVHAMQLDRNDILFMHALVVSDGIYVHEFYQNRDGSYSLDFMPAPSSIYQSTGLDKKSKKLADKITEICEEAKSYSTEYEKAEFVHNYLCDIAEYDFDALNRIETQTADPDDDYIYTAYGCLINRDCVCAGYARAFQAIMNSLGIECVNIFGFGNGDGASWGGHAWNAIRLDGTYYLVDVTWDDLTSSFKYFLITTEKLEEDHCTNPYVYPFNQISADSTAFPGFYGSEELFDLPYCTNEKYMN